MRSTDEACPERRRLIGGLLLGGALLPWRAGGALAQADPTLTDDDGRTVSPVTLPNEVIGELEGLPGVLWLGSPSRALTLYEFFDYNCPYCRVAVKDLHALLRKMPDLRLALVNNPILSPMSAQAAKVHLALLELGGPVVTDGFHQRLLGMPGTNDGPRALKVAADLGVDRSRLEEVANSEATVARLKAGFMAAADLGLRATPSFVAGTRGLLGYPGPKTLTRVLAALDRCGDVACAG